MVVREAKWKFGRGGSLSLYSEMAYGGLGGAVEERWPKPSRASEHSRQVAIIAYQLTGSTRIQNMLNAHLYEQFSVF